MNLVDTPTALASDIEKENLFIQYDKSIKKVLADKPILARILKFTVHELSTLSLQQIASCIDGKSIMIGQTKYMGPIAVAAYSYMSLVPIIQPPIMKLLTTKKEREVKMEQLRPVSKLEKILFPIVVTVVVVLILPTTAPLVGMLMLGNLFKESGVVKQLAETASNALMYIVVIILGTSVGATTSAEAFLNLDTCIRTYCICIWYCSRCVIW